MKYSEAVSVSSFILGGISIIIGYIMTYIQGVYYPHYFLNDIPIFFFVIAIISVGLGKISLALGKIRKKQK